MGLLTSIASINNIQNGQKSTFEHNSKKADDINEQAITIELARHYNEETKKHAVKAQKAAIMARNMSHNLGSHVMAYLKQQMQSSMEIIYSKDCILHNLKPDGDKYSFKDGKNELPFLVGLGYFINYLQERQDYIATVATSYIPYPTPIDFKDAIVDGLNPDLKWKRHRTIGQKPFNILLNYIAKSEGYTREGIESNDNKGHYLRINYINYNLDLETPILISGFEEGALEALKGINAIQLGVPGGTIGRQAVFSIIENITRNAAKHEKNIDSNLNINLGLLDGARLKKYKDKGWISQEMFTDYENCLDTSNLYLLCVSYYTSINDKSSKDDLLKILWDGINEKYVDTIKEGDKPEQFVFVSTNKGIKEIRISASWLRGLLDEEEYTKQNLSPLVYVDIHPVEDNTKNSICYYIGLRKPYKVIIVKDESKKDSSLDVFKIINNELCVEMDATNWDKEGANCCYDFVIAQNKQVFELIKRTSSNRIINWEDCKQMFKSVIEKDSFTEIELMNILYAFHTGIGYSVSGIGCNIVQPILHIFDKDTNLYENDDNRVRILIGDSTLSEDTQYIYRTHHESQAKDFIVNNIRSNETFRDIRIEGITGSNSTVRQIRYAPNHDFCWYCSHIYALRQNVAIFDERLFDAINGISESILKELIVLNGWLQKEDNYDNILEHIFDTNRELFDKIRIRFKSKKELSNYVEQSLNPNLIENSYVHKSAIYAEKGVFIFNVCQYNDTMSVICIIPNREMNKCSFVEVAHICKDGTIKIVERGDFRQMLLSKNGSQVFDTISIHQGILDKVYSFVGCKDNTEKKRNITSQINERFGGVCSRLLIHSGRSKPTFKDMPQEVPFLQYSALENAVFDSKYTLIELLENARYEDNNNN